MRWLPFLPVALAAIVLLAMGQPLWCRCGSPVPWSWETVSMHNSQHLIDAYSFTHVLHGLLFCLGTALFLRIPAVAARMTEPARWTLVLLLEGSWEVLENTPMVIERYRAATISLDYYGDSVLNSLADLGACALGYVFARRTPWWASVLLFIGTEIALVGWIHDSLLLNMLMLVWPVPAVKAWQAG